jgi:hypothetical protein
MPTPAVSDLGAVGGTFCASAADGLDEGDRHVLKRVQDTPARADDKRKEDNVGIDQT